jgi:hypothetical protein
MADNIQGSANASPLTKQAPIDTEGVAVVTDRSEGVAECAVDGNKSSLDRHLETMSSKDGEVEHEASEDSGDSAVESDNDFDMLESSDDDGGKLADGSSDDDQEYESEDDTPPPVAAGPSRGNATTPDWIRNNYCPVPGCGLTFDHNTGPAGPRQGLFHHLKYRARHPKRDHPTWQHAHARAHAEMKQDAGKSKIRRVEIPIVSLS